MPSARAPTTPSTWSRSLRDSDDDSDSPSDEPLLSAPSSSPARAERTSSPSTEGSEWAWGGDTVDIGLVSEPPGLRFVETPFTLAKRTGASKASTALSSAGVPKSTSSQYKVRSIPTPTRAPATAQRPLTPLLATDPSLDARQAARSAQAPLELLASASDAEQEDALEPLGRQDGGATAGELTARPTACSRSRAAAACAQARHDFVAARSSSLDAAGQLAGRARRRDVDERDEQLAPPLVLGCVLAPLVSRAAHTR